MTFTRFRLYTLGSARPAGFRGEIRELWESDDETRFVILSLMGDGTTHLLVMARDAAGRFTAAGAPRMFASLQAARDAVRRTLDGPLPALADVGFAGMNLLSPVAPARRLHPYFRRLDLVPHSAPARRVVKEITPWMQSGDPHFIREFQTDGFDQRLWEIYLWACFREAGYTVAQLEHPDFLLSRGGHALFSVEATTSAPSRGGVLADHPNPQTVEEMTAFLRDYMPMKFGGALTAKLDKRLEGRGYWELPRTDGLPFLIAVADFHVPASRHEPGSMVYSQSALPIYLYGVEYDADHDGSGTLQIGYRKRVLHTFKTKKIEAGFFDLPGAQNVSAVLFSNAGTMSKFTRMGALAGFSSPDFSYVRRGFAVDPDPNAMEGRRFAADVMGPDYREGWGDELQIFHNPRAARPFDPDLLPDATHHHWENDMIVSTQFPWTVLSSVTDNIHATDDLGADEAAFAALLKQD